MLNLPNALRRLVTDPLGTSRYALCRFACCRAMARQLSGFRSSENPKLASKSIFPDLSVEQALLDLSASGLHFGVNLDADMIADIRRFAEGSECKTKFDGVEHRYFFREASDLSERIGRTVVISHIAEPQQNANIRLIASDPKLIEIAARYMNGYPKKIDSRLWWSRAIAVSVQERLKANQTVLFHYDLEGFQFLYFSFYINDVDLETGPHVAVRGTHRKKLLSHLFGSANCSDDSVEAAYGKDNVVTILGKAGTGFIEDTFCFHKALAPTKNDRLLLQIRMSY